MNRYPTWLNALVLIILMVGILIAMPNIYGTIPAVQVANRNGEIFREPRLERITEALELAGITPEAAYLKDGRVVVRFNSDADQTAAQALLSSRF